MNVRRLLAAVLASVAVVGAPPTAEAAPRRTGLIAYGNPLRVVDELGAVRWEGPVGAWPSWSPDGTRLAFTTAGRLSVVELATGQVSEVEGFDGTALLPDWSPDGSMIAFAGTVDGTGHRELFVAPATGCCARRVTTFPAAAYGVGLPRWTADGSRIVIGVELDGGEDVGDELFVVDVASGAARKITGRVTGDAMLFDLSPVDDTVAVVIVGHPGQRLWRVGVDGSAPAPLIPLDSIVPAPAWSPDGRWIAVSDGGLAVVRPDGTQYRRLTDVDAAAVTAPAWFPDGRRMAYVGHMSPAALLTVGLDGGVRRVVARDVDFVWPAVAPVFVPVG